MPIEIRPIAIRIAQSLLLVVLFITVTREGSSTRLTRIFGWIQMECLPLLSCGSWRRFYPVDVVSLKTSVTKTESHSTPAIKTIFAQLFS